jgi:hypothetical protein
LHARRVNSRKKGSVRTDARGMRKNQLPHESMQSRTRL